VGLDAAHVQCHYTSLSKDIYTEDEIAQLEPRFAKMHILLLDVWWNEVNAMPANWHYIPWKANFHYVPQLPGRKVAIAGASIDKQYYARSDRVAQPPGERPWRPQRLLGTSRPLLSTYVGSQKRRHPKKAPGWRVKTAVCDQLFALFTVLCPVFSPPCLA
jgi:hypothetical protein